MTALLVDDREPPWIAKRLTSYGCTVAIDHLDAGDYSFWPQGITAGIERKTITDLLNSMASKRLVAQVHKMVEQYELPILLRVGQFRRGHTSNLEYHDPKHPEADKEGWVRSGWAWSSFQGIMFDIWLMGVIVWDCPVPGSEPEDIAAIVHSLSKEEHKWIKERERPSVLALSKQYRNNIWALCAFSGIGPDIAKDLLKDRSFADVVKLAADNPTELYGNGFGPKRANKLHEEVVQVYG